MDGDDGCGFLRRDVDFESLLDEHEEVEHFETVCAEVTDEAVFCLWPFADDLLDDVVEVCHFILPLLGIVHLKHERGNHATLF